MKNLYLFSFLLLSSLGSYAQCISNGGFEGSLTQVNADYVFTTREDGFDVLNCNIDTSTGFSNDFSANPNSFTSKATRVTGTGFDPILAGYSINVTRVHTGIAAIRLNNNPVSGQADGTVTTMSQSFTASSSVISFFFSLIVEDAHLDDSPQDQPFFTARIYNADGDIINTNEFCITANPDNPVFTLVPGTIILYTDWQCGRLNIPDEYIDQVLTIEFVVTDCGQFQHFGTVYIDDITCDASCENPPLGYIELDPVQYNCPTEAINVCGTFSEPLDSTLQDITLEIIQNNVIIQTLNNPQIVGNTFCFSVDPYSLGTMGAFELFVTGEFLMSNNFVHVLFDQSSVPGVDLMFSSINPSDASVTGNILSWPDISDTYEIEFVSDNTCCPGGGAVSGSYSITLSTNQIDLTIVETALQSKCFRWRIRTEECSNWSEWCCLAYDNANQFPEANYGNLLEEICYPEGCVPTLHATFTETGNLFEQRDVWITAVNTIDATANVTYQAGEFVELQPGFNTVTNAVFLAHIADCIEETFAAKKLTFTNSGKEEYSYEYEQEINQQGLNGFTVYPNPTNGKLTVTFESKVSSFSIIDITGKQLMTVNNNNPNEITLDLTGLAPGVYFLSADGMPIQKIIKN